MVMDGVKWLIGMARAVWVCDDELYGSRRHTTNVCSAFNSETVTTVFSVAKSSWLNCVCFSGNQLGPQASTALVLSTVVLLGQFPDPGSWHYIKSATIPSEIN
jgi:hypothetical protein